MIAACCKVAGFDLIIVETSGIGQGDAAIVPLVDVPMYVMTPEFGAASQLEKIDMLDFAEFVAINKFDRKGALDALRDVSKQVQRNKEAWTTPKFALLSPASPSAAPPSPKSACHRQAAQNRHRNRVWHVAPNGTRCVSHRQRPTGYGVVAHHPLAVTRIAHHIAARGTADLTGQGTPLEPVIQAGAGAVKTAHVVQTSQHNRLAQTHVAHGLAAAIKRSKPAPLGG